jgi:rhodanese-related sulfurtransferase
MVTAWVGFLVAATMIAFFAALFHHEVGRIHTAREWLSRGAILVDVDDAGEFALHHPRVAVSIPRAELARRAHELGPTSQPIVVFAHAWRRGAMAASELRSIGYWDVLNVAGVRTKEKLSAAVSRAEALRDDSGEPELAPVRP